MQSTSYKYNFLVGFINRKCYSLPKYVVYKQTLRFYLCKVQVSLPYASKHLFVHSIFC